VCEYGSAKGCMVSREVGDTSYGGDEYTEGKTREAAVQAAIELWWRRVKRILGLDQKHNGACGGQLMRPGEVKTEKAMNYSRGRAAANGGRGGGPNSRGK